MEARKLSAEIVSSLRSGCNVINVSQCVNELVLNSLDAKSRNIAVRINLQMCRIQVVDDGQGITRANLQLIGTRYMTNKCHTLKDYETISKTYGFKGESLASIKDNSRSITIQTKCVGAETFSKTLTSSNVNDAELIKNRPSQGTTVTVDDFLHNLPVRRNGLNADLELHNIKSNLELLSIIHPSVTFTLRNDFHRKMIYSSKKVESVEAALISLHPQLESDFFGVLKMNSQLISVIGLIYKKMIDCKVQYIYLNRQPVESNALHRLINDGLTNSLMYSKNKGDKFVYLLNIKSPYSNADLTIHGTKTFVEFRNWDVVNKFMQKFLAKFLRRERLELITVEKCVQKKKIPSIRDIRLSNLGGACKSKIMRRNAQSVSVKSKNSVLKMDDKPMAKTKKRTIDKGIMNVRMKQKKIAKQIILSASKIDKNVFKRLFAGRGSDEELSTCKIVNSLNIQQQKEIGEYTENNNNGGNLLKTDNRDLADSNNYVPTNTIDTFWNINNQKIGKAIVMEKFLKSGIEHKPEISDNIGQSVSIQISQKTVGTFSKNRPSMVSTMSCTQIRNETQDVLFQTKSFFIENNENFGDTNSSVNATRIVTSERQEFNPAQNQCLTKSILKKKFNTDPNSCEERDKGNNFNLDYKGPHFNKEYWQVKNGGPGKYKYNRVQLQPKKIVPNYNETFRKQFNQNDHDLLQLQFKKNRKEENLLHMEFKENKTRKTKYQNVIKPNNDFLHLQPKSIVNDITFKNLINFGRRSSHVDNIDVIRKNGFNLNGVINEPIFNNDYYTNTLCFNDNVKDKDLPRTFKNSSKCVPNFITNFKINHNPNIATNAPRNYKRHQEKNSVENNLQMENKLFNPTVSSIGGQANFGITCFKHINKDSECEFDRPFKVSPEHMWGNKYNNLTTDNDGYNPISKNESMFNPQNKDRNLFNVPSGILLRRIENQHLNYPERTTTGHENVHREEAVNRREDDNPFSTIYDGGMNALNNPVDILTKTKLEILNFLNEGNTKHRNIRYEEAPNCTATREIEGNSISRIYGRSNECMFTDRNRDTNRFNVPVGILKTTENQHLSNLNGMNTAREMPSFSIPTSRIYDGNNERTFNVQNRDINVSNDPDILTKLEILNFFNEINRNVPYEDASNCSATRDNEGRLISRIHDTNQHRDKNNVPVGILKKTGNQYLNYHKGMNSAHQNIHYEEAATRKNVDNNPISSLYGGSNEFLFNVKNDPVSVLRKTKCPILNYEEARNTKPNMPHYEDDNENIFETFYNQIVIEDNLMNEYVDKNYIAEATDHHEFAGYKQPMESYQNQHFPRKRKFIPENTEHYHERRQRNKGQERNYETNTKYNRICQNLICNEIHADCNFGTSSDNKQKNRVMVNGNHKRAINPQNLYQNNTGVNLLGFQEKANYNNTRNLNNLETARRSNRNEENACDNETIFPTYNSHYTDLKPKKRTHDNVKTYRKAVLEQNNIKTSRKHKEKIKSMGHNQKCESAEKRLKHKLAKGAAKKYKMKEQRKLKQIEEKLRKHKTNSNANETKMTKNNYSNKETQTGKSLLQLSPEATKVKLFKEVFIQTDEPAASDKPKINVLSHIILASRYETSNKKLVKQNQENEDNKIMKDKFENKSNVIANDLSGNSQCKETNENLEIRHETVHKCETNYIEQFTSQRRFDNNTVIDVDEKPSNPNMSVAALNTNSLDNVPKERNMNETDCKKGDEEIQHQTGENVTKIETLDIKNDKKCEGNTFCKLFHHTTVCEQSFPRASFENELIVSESIIKQSNIVANNQVEENTRYVGMSTSTEYNCVHPKQLMQYSQLNTRLNKGDEYINKDPEIVNNSAQHLFKNEDINCSPLLFDTSNNSIIPDSNSAWRLSPMNFFTENTSLFNFCSSKIDDLPTQDVEFNLTLNLQEDFPSTSDDKTDFFQMPPNTKNAISNNTNIEFNFNAENNEKECEFNELNIKNKLPLTKIVNQASLTKINTIESIPNSKKEERFNKLTTIKSHFDENLAEDKMCASWTGNKVETLKQNYNQIKIISPRINTETCARLMRDVVATPKENKNQPLTTSLLSQTNRDNRDIELNPVNKSSQNNIRIKGDYSKGSKQSSSDIVISLSEEEKRILLLKDFENCQPSHKCKNNLHIESRTGQANEVSFQPKYEGNVIHIDDQTEANFDLKNVHTKRKCQDIAIENKEISNLEHDRVVPRSKNVNECITTIGKGNLELKDNIATSKPVNEIYPENKCTSGMIKRIKQNQIQNKNNDLINKHVKASRSSKEIGTAEKEGGGVPLMHVKKKDALQEQYHTIDLTVPKKHCDASGKTYIIHDRTGMTLFGNVEKKPNFTLTKRSEFVPKGQSPILMISEPSHVSLTSSGKIKLYDALADSYMQELGVIKWNKIMNRKDPRKFFDEIYKHLPNKSSLPVLSIKDQTFTLGKSRHLKKELVFSRNILNQLRVIGQLDKKFIVTLAQNSMLIIFDQHAVHERIRVEKLFKDYTMQQEDGNEDLTYKSTKIKLKLELRISKCQDMLLQKYNKFFQKMGLKYIQKGLDLELSAIPTCLFNKFQRDKSTDKLKQLVTALVEEELDIIQSTNGIPSYMPKVIQDTINSEACRGSIMFGDALDSQKCAELISKLKLCKLPFQCAHGRPTIAPITEVPPSENKSNKVNLRKLMKG